MVNPQYQVGDHVRVRKEWGGPRGMLGATAVIRGFTKSVFSREDTQVALLAWDYPTWGYGPNAKFDLFPWFELAEGPW